MSDAEIFDVIIVGSGAAGGMVAHDLAFSGLNVVMLEAGRDYDSLTETPMFSIPEDAPLRGEITVDKQGGFYDATVDGGWDIPGEPFTVAQDSEDFGWWRPRMLGGRTNHWGRVALRFGAYDFAPRSRDSLGFDWPIGYHDLAPWYDNVERLIGVTGLAHGIENTPDSPPGILLPPPPLRPHEIFLASAFESFGMRVAAMRAAILTRPLRDRAACLYATPCTRGCSIRATFQSSTVLISPARATGRLHVRTDAVVRHVDMNRHWRATGVTYVDRKTGQLHAVRGRVVVLAAGAGSSARILLNSRTDVHPDGIGNSNGLVGKYIADTVEFTMISRVPALERLPAHNSDGMFTPHIYVPWWLYKEQAEGRLNFPRGYHIEPRGGRRMPAMNIGGYVDPDSNTYGAPLQAEICRKYGTYVQLSGEGEMVPNEDTYCELDPGMVDKWGIPVLRFHWRWGDYERRQLAHMHSTFNEIFRLLGGNTDSGVPVMPKGGGANHMVGGVRMGSSPQSSVVDPFGRCWDVRNLFVLDGSIFVSSPDKNPTLTILALASRGAARIVELLQRREL
jgi:choline dehydrogenase-like flavoprotein